jgi:hypothetical protein
MAWLNVVGSAAGNTLTLPALTLQAHDLVIISVITTAGSAPTYVSITDGTNSVGINHSSLYYSAGLGYSGLQGWVLDAAAVVNSQFTITLSGVDGTIYGSVIVWRGWGSGAAIDQATVEGEGMSDTALATPNITTTGADVVCIASVGFDNSGSNPLIGGSAPDGEDANTTSFWRNVSLTNGNASETQAPAGKWILLMSSFKEVAGGGGGGGEKILIHR